MKILARALLRAFRPLRSIATDLHALRLLAERIAHEHLNVIVPDEKLLASTPKADRVEFSYGVGKPQPGWTPEQEGIESEADEWLR